MQSSYFGVFSAVAGSGIVVKLVLLFLLILSIYSWSVILNKYKLIQQKSSLVSKLRKVLKNNKNDFTKLLADFSTIKNNPYVNILKFLHSNKGILIVNGNVNQAVGDSVYNFLHDINQPTEKKVAGLATIGNSAPFIGLFGTVIGIINSFSSIGEASSASLAVIAPGIAEALYTTAFGLFVAVPAAFGYNYFANKLEDYKDEQSILIQELIVNFIKNEAIEAEAMPRKFEQAKLVNKEYDEEFEEEVNFEKQAEQEIKDIFTKKAANKQDNKNKNR